VDFADSRWRINFFLVLLVAAVVYGTNCYLTNKGLFTLSGIPYLNYLLDAFFDQRMDVISPSKYDLSLYEGKWYLYWGPAPVLFVLPFYLVSGVHTSDVLYTLVAGLSNVILFSLIIIECAKYFRLKLSNGSYSALVLSFALASPNLFLSVGARIWFTHQVIAVFFLLGFLFFLFKFLNNPHDRILFFLSVIFFNLAWCSRVTLVVYGLLLIFPLLDSRSHPENRYRLVFISVSTSLLFFLFWGAYNYARFGNVFEMGARYIQGSDLFEAGTKAGSFHSFQYVYRNFKYYFLEHLYLSVSKPFAQIEPWGNSIFSVYPFLLLSLFLPRKSVFTRAPQRIFLVLSISILAMGMVHLLTFISTGWVQFGQRYFFDFAPLWFLIIIFGISAVPPILQSVLVLYGFLVNQVGIGLFYDF